jgi:rare lipoprotein A
MHCQPHYIRSSRLALLAMVSATVLAIAAVLTITGCQSTAPAETPLGSSNGKPLPANKTNSAKPNLIPPALTLPPANSGRGGYYQDDGPGEAPPPNLDSVPDPQPQIEPYAARGNKPYVVFGKTYTPITDMRPWRQEGIGSWYGKKFHGQKTSSGEIYDMYKVTAAHPTLPIPSYARVTNLKTGTQVVVRINDRGPFHAGRIIDLSYTAALKLGYIGHGSALLEVERLLPEDIVRMNNQSNPTLNAPMANALTLNTPIPNAPTPNAPTPNAPTPLAVEIGSIKNSAPLNPPTQDQSIDDFLKTPSVPISVDTIAAVQEPPDIAEKPNNQTIEPPVLISGKFYLQFGAYSQQANAEASRQRLMESWPSALPTPEVYSSDHVYRLYSGPFDSRSDATQASTLTDNALTKSIIVQH